MGFGRVRPADLRDGGNRKGDAIQAEGERVPYAPPTLTVYGSLVDLTQKQGGPGRDNPHFRRSF
jgi:hypothetical protein